MDTLSSVKMLLILFHILVNLGKLVFLCFLSELLLWLYDIGASSSAIPYELYREIMHEIGSRELEEIDVVIQLANRETISPIGIVTF